MKNIFLGTLVCLAFGAGAYAQDVSADKKVEQKADQKDQGAVAAPQTPADAVKAVLPDTDAMRGGGGGGGRGGGGGGGHIGGGGGGIRPGGGGGGHIGGGGPRPGPVGGGGHIGGGGPRPGPVGGGGHGGGIGPRPGGPGHGGGVGPRPGGPGHGGGIGPRPGGPGHGGGGWHGSPGWHNGGPRPGWNAGWHRDLGWRPGWWRIGFPLPVFFYAPEVPFGYWQCTAFDQNQQSYSASAPGSDEAAYNALYDCGGPDYQGNGCFIPPGYCERR